MLNPKLLSCLQVCGIRCEIRPGLHGLKFNTWCPQSCYKANKTLNELLHVEKAFPVLWPCSSAQITPGLWLSGRAGPPYPSTGNILFPCRITEGSASVKGHFWCFKLEFALRHHRMCWASEVRALMEGFSIPQLFGVRLMLNLCTLWVVQENLRVFKSL